MIGEMKNIRVTRNGRPTSFTRNDDGSISVTLDDASDKIEVSYEVVDEPSLYAKAVKHYQNHPDYKIGWPGQVHLFLGALFPNMIFSKRDKVVCEIEKMLLNSEQADERSVARKRLK